jgi:hypothetical protein
MEGEMMNDPEVVGGIRESWDAFEALLPRVRTGTVASFAGIPGASRGLSDLAYNLIVVHAYAVLEKALSEYERAGVLESKWHTLEPLMKASKGYLPWQDYELVWEGKRLRDAIAHRFHSTDGKECFRFFEAIHNEMKAWGIAST